MILLEFGTDHDTGLVKYDDKGQLLEYTESLLSLPGESEQALEERMRL